MGITDDLAEGMKGAYKAKKHSAGENAKEGVKDAVDMWKDVPATKNAEEGGEES